MEPARRSLLRLLMIFGTVGFIVPVIFTLIGAAFYLAGTDWRIRHLFAPLLLILWPTSIGAMALDGQSAWSVASLEFIFELAMLNSLFYVVIGLVTWALIKLFKRVA